MGRLVIDGNSVYEIDEECERRKLRQNDPEGQENRQERKDGMSGQRKKPGKR